MARENSTLTYDSPSVMVLFQLLRIALGKEEPSSLPNDVNLEEVYELSLKQGVGAIACDGMLALENCNIDEVLKYKWMGQSMLIEQKYYRHLDVISKLASFYHQNGINMMLLKGYGLSLNYPRPEHRPPGDIDIFLKSDDGNKKVWQLGDNDMRKKLGIKVDSSHEHHTVFNFLGQTVENHYDFINTKGTRSSRFIENRLKLLSQKEGQKVGVERDMVELPCADFNAIFIMRHMGQHFAGAEISLRHILDWATFVEVTSKLDEKDSVRWAEVIPFWEKIGILNFAKCINSVCVQHLGIDSELFYGQLSKDEKLLARVLNDIICPEFSEKKEGDFFPTILFRTRRFYANRWKRKLVYKEGIIEQFFTGSLAHLKRFRMIKE